MLAKPEFFVNSRILGELSPWEASEPLRSLIQEATRISSAVYCHPESSDERHLPPSLHHGRKKLAIRRCDATRTVFVAIRGSYSAKDYVDNLRFEPTSPAGFLDDSGNMCHAGFLSAARHLVGPLARELRLALGPFHAQTLSRAYSLVLTGHSAGGAVASLLYAHLMSSTTQVSDLKEIAQKFRSIHCINFGAPPFAQRPVVPDGPPADSVFLTIVNEGDPITRVDKAYLFSLARLYTSRVSALIKRLGAPAAAAAATSAITTTTTLVGEPLHPKQLADRAGTRRRASTSDLLHPLAGLKLRRTASAPELLRIASWPVPARLMVSAGQLIVFRQVPGEDRVAAFTTSHECLDGVVFSQLKLHGMKQYERGVSWL